MTDPIVAALRELVTSYRLTRIPLEELQRAAHAADPVLLGNPDSRARIRAAIDTLSAEGTVVAPTGSRGWDVRAAPPLPLWVRRPAAAKTPQAPSARIWSTPLAGYAAAATLRQLEVLEAIERWRSANPNPVPAPYAERSLEVFGDEKRLTAVMGWQLFRGQLAALLDAYPVPLPFPAIWVPGKGPAGLLVAENVATWHSIVTALRAMPESERPNLHVGWGNGAQIESAIVSAVILDPRPVDIRYFGDLDVAGLRFPRSADRAARGVGLPEVRPAESLYRALLAQSIRGVDASQRGKPDLDGLVAWLPSSLRAPARQILQAGERIPQEAVSLSILASSPELLASPM